MRKAIIFVLLLVFLFQLSSYSEVRGEYFVFAEGALTDPFTSENWRYTRYDPYINFNWRSGPTDIPNMQNDADNFAIKWTGTIFIPTTGDWTFYTNTDDGVRLYIDEVLKIDQWTGIGEYSTGALPLNAGPHTFEMQYVEKTGDAYAKLSFEGPGVDKQVIPKSYFNTFHTANNLPLHCNFDGYDANYGGGTLYGDASIISNILQLTPNNYGQYGGWVFPPGIAMYSFDFKCDVYMTGGGENGADGISFSYSDIDTPPLNESGDSYPGLAVRLRTYTHNLIELAYNGSEIVSVPAKDLRGGWKTLIVRVKRNAITGGATVEVWFNGTRRINSTISDWNPPASWKIALGARTGGERDLHLIDRLSLYSYDPYVSSITRLSPNPVLSGTNSIQYSVIFSEPMYYVDASDFILSRSGTANATIQPISSPTVYITENFSSSQGIGTLEYDAVISGGVLKLTENVNGKFGVWHFTPPEILNSFTAGFDMRIWDGNGADGLCFCYGRRGDNPWGWGLSGVSNGLTIFFDTYENGNEFTPALVIKYNDIELQRVKNNDIRSSSYIPVRVRVTEDGICSVYQTAVNNGGFVPRAHVRIPGWAPQSNWAISFAGATGGLNDKHYIDNFTIVNNKQRVGLSNLGGTGTVRLDIHPDNDIVHFQKYALYPKEYTSGETYIFDLDRPTVTAVEVVGPREVDVTFSEAMGPGVTIAENYTLSGTGKGTLPANPVNVGPVSGNTYRCTWNSGEMLQGGDITITVNNVVDINANLITYPNRGKHIGGGMMMDSPTVSDVTSPPFTNTFPITINYTGAADTTSGVSNVELWFKKGSSGIWEYSGQSSVSAPDGSITFNNPTGDDTYYFDIVVIDGAGNRSEIPVGVEDGRTNTEVDMLVPWVTVDRLVTKNAKPVLTGQMGPSDTSLEVIRVSVTVGGYSNTAELNTALGEWSMELLEPLSNGIY
ncbi:MAG TPA: PA14 domain-containing protein, partial [Candidatus Hydrogenedens sp.]|nr:PA14 domain-containing protein [Candidatus Hydrogenedens sp.]